MPRNYIWDLPSWEGLPIILTDHAADRAFDLRIDIYDIAAILEGGYDCEKGRRKSSIRERCSKWKGQTIRVIVSQEPSGWIDDNNAWIVMSIKIE